MYAVRAINFEINIILNKLNKYHIELNLWNIVEWSKKCHSHLLYSNLSSPELFLVSETEIAIK